MRYVLALFLSVLAFSANAAPHVHWRVHMTETNSIDSWFASMNEVEFQNNATRIATTGGVASASSDQGATDPRQPALAFDSNTTSLWSTLSGVGGPAWIAYTFSSAVDVTGLRMVTGGSAGRVARAPEAFSVQWSDDGTNWTTLEAFTASGWVDGQYQTFNVTPVTPPETPPSSNTDMTINCSVPNCAVTIQVAQVPTANADVMQAQSLLFAAVFTAGVLIWGVRRVLGLFIDHTPGD